MGDGKNASLSDSFFFPIPYSPLPIFYCFTNFSEAELMQ
jgi:hypothetical protein